MAAEQPIARDFEDHDNAKELTGEREDTPTQSTDSVGELLSLPEPAAAKKAVKLFTDQARRPDIRQQMAQWQVNAWRREGYCNVRVEKVENQQRYKAYMEPGGEMVPAYNKLDDLCEKITNQIYVDPPGPECIPASGEASDVESAELAERILRDVQAEDHLDDLTAHREAFDLAHTYGRTYVRYWVDPEGALVPEQVLAAPAATSADTPFDVEVPSPVDPFTGMPMGPPTMQPAPGPYALRYVTAERGLSDRRADATMIWAPRLRSEVLDGRFVRYLPAPSRNLEHAEGVAIGCYRSVGELRSMFREAMEKMSDEDVRKLTTFQPSNQDAQALWPEGSPKSNDGESVPLDDRMVFVVTIYYESCPAYPEGLYLCAAGESTLLHRGPWQAEMPDGTVEPLPVPLAEHRKTQRGRRQPVPLTEVLGGMNEQRQIILGHWLQFLDDFANRAVFVSQYGTIKAEDLEYRNSKYIPYLPGHEPVSEKIPEFPPTTLNLLEFTDQSMNTGSGLAQAAQGVEDASVTSGAHAREIRSAALVALSGDQQSAAAAYVRACRIQLQLIRGHFSVPQQIGWTGEDGQYRQRYWSASDLTGTRDVRLKKGTLTLLSASAKAQEAVYYATVGGNPKQGVPGIIAGEELREIIGDRLGADLGIKDNPHRMRARRQISAWLDGPPEGWQPPPVPPPQLVLGPMGPQQVQPPAPPDPTLSAIWAPEPVDVIPDVAALRYFELSRVMSTMKYQAKPAPWKQAFIAEWERMRQAAGVYTLQEQMMMQAQQAAQQAQQQAQAGGDKVSQQRETQHNAQAKQAAAAPDGNADLMAEQDRVEASA